MQSCSVLFHCRLPSFDHILRSFIQCVLQLSAVIFLRYNLMQNDILPFLRLRWPEDPCHISLIAILRLWFEWTEPGPFFLQRDRGSIQKSSLSLVEESSSLAYDRIFGAGDSSRGKNIPTGTGSCSNFSTLFILYGWITRYSREDIFGSLSYYAERADLQINNIRNFSPKCRWEPSSVFFSVPSLRRLFLAIIMNYLFSSRRLGPSIFSISRRSFRLTNILYYLLPPVPVLYLSLGTSGKWCFELLIEKRGCKAFLEGENIPELWFLAARKHKKGESPPTRFPDDMTTIPLDSFFRNGYRIERKLKQVLFARFAPFSWALLAFLARVDEETTWPDVREFSPER